MSSAALDILVIGAGPAGLAAAAAAAEAGASVLLVDENDRPGGQLFKQIHKFFGSERHHAGVRGFEIGKLLVERVEEAGVELRLSTAVFGIYPGLIPGVYTQGQRAEYLRPRRMILAVGATERGLAFPGWTLPGVMGAGAAQTLMNIHRVLPGRRAVIVGSGNVGLIVGYQFLQAGGEVAAVVEAAANVGGYAVHAAKLRREGVAIHTGHSIVGAQGEEWVERVRIGRLEEGGGFAAGSDVEIEADLVLLAVGLTPQVDLARMAGCELDWNPGLGGHVVRVDDDLRTSVPEVFVAGDLAGIEEASIAMEEGRLAGLACAESLGFAAQGLDELKGECRRRLVELRGVGSAAVLEERHLRARGQRQGPVAVIECPQRIPCNPCESACRFGAIVVGDDISALPSLDAGKCNGCGECVRLCPGLAVFLVQEDPQGRWARVTLPFELPGMPEKGQVVEGLDRQGRPVCRASVWRVSPGKGPGGTALVTLEMPPQYADDVRSFRRVKS